jgi:hypothetical protein
VLTAGQPIGEAPVVVILVHGRGAGPENILDLVPALGVAGVTYLAPAATNRTWYPYGFMSDIAKNEPFLSSALSVLESLVAHLVWGLFAGCVPHDRVCNQECLALWRDCRIQRRRDWAARNDLGH